MRKGIVHDEETVIEGGGANDDVEQIGTLRF